MKRRSALEVALFQITSQDPAIRKLGAQALCALQPRRAVRTIRDAFRSEQEPGVAKWLALALGKTGGGKESIAVLEARLKVLPDCDLRDWILVSLNLLRGFVTDQDVIARLESSDHKVNKDGLVLAWSNPRVRKHTKSSQRELLESPDASVRRWASLSLGSQEDFRPDELVLEHLTDPDSLVLEWTEHAITKRVPPTAVPILESNLGHCDPRVREWAIKALASSGAPDVYPRLIKHYAKETDDFCRDAILRSLLPVCATREVHDFLLKCANDALSPIILSALIYLAASSPTLHADETFASSLVSKTNQSDDPILQIAVEGAFASQLSRADIELLGKLNKSTNAKRAWQFFSTLPWSTPTSPQSSLLAQAGRSTSSMRTGNAFCDVAILIAKKDEFRAFLAILGAYRADNDPTTGKSSYRFNLPGAIGRPLSLAALLIGGMGNERSALWAHKLNSDVQPSVLVSLGIAGGIHDDVRLGDVVVASQVDNYLADAKAVPKASAEEYDFALAGDPFKTDVYFTNAAQNIEFSNLGIFLKWQEDCSTSYDQALAPNKDALIDKDLLRLSPRLEEGHIASGPVVGAATAFTTWLKGKRDRSYLALEMESAGAALAIHESASGIRHLVIRGISDYADERKKELDNIQCGGIRALAMQNATKFLFALLSNVPTPAPKGTSR